MHLRYDLQNCLNLSNFSKQANFFLNKENSDFSFYLSDFAIHFGIAKNIEKENDYTIEVTISEQNKDNNPNNEYKAYKSIDPNVDIRFKDLSMMQEIFQTGSLVGVTNKKSISECIDYMITFVKVLHKLNKFSIMF